MFELKLNEQSQIFIFNILDGKTYCSLWLNQLASKSHKYGITVFYI